MLDHFLSRLRAFLGEPLAKSLRRRLRAAAPSPISELREGLHCRIAGTVRLHDKTTLTAPFSGAVCVAYLLEIVETLAGGGEHVLVYDKRGTPAAPVCWIGDAPPARRQRSSLATSAAAR